LGGGLGHWRNGPNKIRGRDEVGGLNSGFYGEKGKQEAGHPRDNPATRVC